MPYLKAAVFTLLFFALLTVGSVTSLGQRYLKTIKLFYTTHFISKSSFIEEKLPAIVQERGLPDFSKKEKKERSEAQIEEAKADIKENLQISMPVVSRVEKSPENDQPVKNNLLIQNGSILKLNKEILTVKPGDTLLGLAMEMYGYADKRALEQIQRENPEIRDVDMIDVGQKIVFSKPPFRSNRSSSIYSVHIASFKPLKLARSVFERLIKGGFEPYILPFDHPQKGKMFRVAVGAFKDKESAKYYGKKLIDMGVVEYAEPISIDVM